MAQLSLLETPAPTSAPPVEFWPDFLSPAEADRLLDQAQNLMQWQQNQIEMYGKRLDLPRLEAIAAKLPL
jgi:hypothetical protein